MSGMISIRFGLYFDGAYLPWCPAALGDVQMGPYALLSHLEAQLGLGGIWPTSAQRVIQMRAAVKKTSESGRFFAASFEADELGCSRELLRWRDSLLMDGWDGKFHRGFSARLRDLAALEEYLPEECRSSLGDRLGRVFISLRQRTASIHLITSVDPHEAFPLAWRRVLNQLPVTFLAEPLAAAETGTILNQLQQALRRSSQSRDAGKVHWRDDGSFTVVETESRLVVARWLAEKFKRDPSRGSRLIIAGDHAELLDHVFDAAGCSRHGFAETSAYRPSLQVLPLALALSWDPTDYLAALEFLTHPVCPLPKYARERFADRISDRPGLRKDHLADLVEEVKAHFPDRPVIEIELDQWLFNDRFSANDGAPLLSVLDRVVHLHDYFVRRVRTDDSNSRVAFVAAQRQCAAMVTSVSELITQGEQRISPVQLQKLLTEATAAGSTNPLLKPEVGCAYFAEQPGAAIDPVDSVIWWQIAAPSMIPSVPLSRAEVRQLFEAGVEVPSAAQRLSIAAMGWLRPLLAARHSITIVLPPDSEEAHPVWQLVKSLVAGMQTIKPEHILAEDMPAVFSEKVDHRPLPQRKRWWTLPKGTVPHSIGSVSFSSLQLYLHNPYQWVLQYPASLRSSRILSVPDEFTMSGNVAHAVMERLFSRKDVFKLTDDVLAAHTAEILESVIASEAGLFLMQGRLASSERLRRLVVQAVRDLCSQLRAAGVKEVRSEVSLAGSFAGEQLSGSIDLVARSKTGERLVLDLKWAGGKKYPDLLKRNAHLQLIIYASLIQQNHGEWPKAGYYLLSSASLLAQDRSVFKEARICAPETTVTFEKLWKSVEKTWAWRAKQLKSGLIEVVLESLEADEQSVVPTTGFPVEVLSENYNEFLSLAGVEH